MTVLGIVFVDLLVGIAAGLAVSTVTVLYQQWLAPYKVGDDGAGAPVRLLLAENVSFFNKAPLQHALEAIPEGGSVVVDARKAAHVDLDVVEMLEDYHADGGRRAGSITRSSALSQRCHRAPARGRAQENPRAPHRDLLRASDRPAAPVNHASTS